MSTDNKLKEIKLRLQLIMLLRKLNKIYAHDKAISSDEPKWITVHPHGKGAINKNGEDIKGTPVLLESETGEVLGGMGGKYNGVHISEACSKENTLNTQHDIKRGQMMRENPQKFAAEQKAREQKAQQHLKDLQDTAKKETAKEQQKAKEKQDQIKEKQDQATEQKDQQASNNVTPPAAQTVASPDTSLLKTETKDIAKDHKFDDEGILGSLQRRNEKPRTLSEYRDWDEYKKKHCADAASINQSKLEIMATGPLSKWKGAKGIQLDDPKQRKAFKNLEWQVYRYQAMEREYTSKNQDVPKEIKDQGEKMKTQYNEFCKQWAASASANIKQEFDAIEKDFDNFVNRFNVRAGYCTEFKTELMRNPSGKLGAKTDEVLRTLVNNLSSNTEGFYNYGDSKQNTDTVQTFIATAARLKMLKSITKAYNLSEKSQEEYQKTKDALTNINKKAQACLLASTGEDNAYNAITQTISKTVYDNNQQRYKFSKNVTALAGVKKGAPMSFEQADGSSCNPHYTSGALVYSLEKKRNIEPYRVNCQSCVLAYEMRRRGFDIEAQPNMKNDDINKCLTLSADCVGAWRDPKTGAAPVVTHHAASDTQTLISSLSDVMKIGERHAVMGAPNSFFGNTEAGHIFIAERDKKGVFLYDPQTTKKCYMDEVGSPTSMNVIYLRDFQSYRIDNCEINTNFADGVLTKGGGGLMYGLKSEPKKDN